MNKVSVSAPGKLMLLGEHAVVYGYPCLVTAVNKRISVTVEKIDSDKISFNFSVNSKSDFVQKAVALFFRKYNLRSGLLITTSSGFPPTLGLGSSSAVTVATLKALCEIFEIKLSKARLFDLAFEVITGFQELSSGFDLAAAIYGGTVYYRKNSVPEILPFKRIPLLVVYSGVKADTSSMIDSVAQLKKSYPGKINKIFNQIGVLVEKAKIACRLSDWQTLGKLFNLNQEKLAELGVSTDSIDRLVYTAQKTGALGAKLSGAGGGDCILVLYNPELKNTLITALTEANGKIIELNLDQKGIIVK